MLRTSRLGTLLVGSRTITEDQLNRALDFQKQQDCRLGEALIELGYCSEVEITRALAEQMDLAFIDLSLTPPEPHVLRMVPRDLAVRLGIVPVRIELGRMLVAAKNPLDISIDEALRGAVRMPVAVCAAAPGQVSDTLQNYERLKWSLDTAGAVRPPSPPAAGVPLTAPPFGGGASVRAEQQILQRLQALIGDALRKGARDIYFQPLPNGLEVRGWVDGVMQPLEQMTGTDGGQMLNSLRALCGFAAGRERAASTCEIRVDGNLQQFACRSMPVIDGLVIILRARSGEGAPLRLDQLGLEPEMLRAVRAGLATRTGLVLVAGPMESGRSTTLYAMLQEVSQPSLRIVTVEGSAEARVPGALQFQFDSHRAEANRLKVEALSERPDVLLLDELEDRPMAEAACRLAMESTLVLGGVYAPHALRALARFADLGLPAYTTASALTGILAQRLVRRLCPDCSGPTLLPPDLERVLASLYGNLSTVAFRRGKGCARCHGMGTRGRIGVLEWIEVDEDLRRLLSDRAMPSAIQEHLDRRGHRSLEHDAFRKAAAGLISPEEILGLRLETARKLAETIGQPLAVDRWE